LVGLIEASLKELETGSATQHGFKILAVEVISDHVNLFLSAPPKFAPDDTVRLFNGVTFLKLKKEFESLRHHYLGKHATLWAEGFYVGTTGYVSAKTVKRHIEDSHKKQFQTLMF